VEQAFSYVFADSNTSQPAGIAVTGLTPTTNGTWQYQLAGTSGWSNFPKVSVGAALLLGANDLIRFVPTSSTFTGLATLQAHAWDSSVLGFSAGHTVNLSKKGSSGGTTPFSTAILTGRLSFNHAPTQNPVGGISLPAIAENAPSKAVSVATLLKGAQAADVDKGERLGLALTGATGPGTWQYELPGGLWQNVPASLSDASVLLLPGTALLRFDPTVNNSGTATVTWDAWEGTQCTSAQQGFAITLTGGATAFSSTSATATLAVTPSKHLPAWSGNGPVLTPVLPGNSNLSGDTVASVFGSYFKAASAPVGIAVSAVSGTKNGQWQCSTDGGTTWQSLATVSASQARLLAANDRIRFVPGGKFLGTVALTAYAWDGSTGSAGGTARVKGSAFSATPLTATCLVNTAPSIS
jgi:hypothetical protein